jgi:hypothetical protein
MQEWKYRVREGVVIMTIEELQAKHEAIRLLQEFNNDYYSEGGE